MYHSDGPLMYIIYTKERETVVKWHWGNHFSKKEGIWVQCWINGGIMLGEEMFALCLYYSSVGIVAMWKRAERHSREGGEGQL